MKVTKEISVADYNKAIELFTEHLHESATIRSTELYYGVWEYTVTWQENVISVPLKMRKILATINVQTQDELDALSYADEAIKTLMDMGVI